VLIVALTGGIGSGKSLAGQYFAALGAHVIDADHLSRAVIERGTVGFDEVVATFGDGILCDGEIDRRLLGKLVFSSVSKRHQLEAIVHPLVRHAFNSAVAHLQSNGRLIYEIPLLVETGAAPAFDYVITIESDLQIRIERLKNRGMSRSDIEKRISTQATDEQRIASADYVIRNDGSSDDLLREVEYLWESVLPTLEHKKS
jgi:dephospho-CoA kinase